MPRHVNALADNDSEKKVTLAVSGVAAGPVGLCDTAGTIDDRLRRFDELG
jgi:hypothetical protein